MMRDQRHEGTPLDLDRIKLQAKRQASAPSRGGIVRPARRAVTVLISLGLIASGTGAAAAMSGKLHVFKHHKTASAAWFQYKPPCPPGKKGTVASTSKGARAAWKHDQCKPPPPCSKASKAHAAGVTKGCKPPPCSKTSKARAAGVSHGCKPPPCSKTSAAHAAGVNNGCGPPPCSTDSKARAAGVSQGCRPESTTTAPDNTLQPQTQGVAPTTQVAPTQGTKTVKHKAKSRKKHHKAKPRKARKHHSKKQSKRR